MKHLVTRFCRERHGYLRSEYNPKFIWPRYGLVEAPDWDPTPECGKGLHGWLNGLGDPDVWGCQENDVMLFVEGSLEIMCGCGTPKSTVFMKTGWGWTRKFVHLPEGVYTMTWLGRLIKCNRGWEF